MRVANPATVRPNVRRRPAAFPCAALLCAALFGGACAVREAPPAASPVVDAEPSPPSLVPPHAALFEPLPWPTPNEARAASGAPGPGYWQQETDYAIDATLDAAKRSVTGKARITYRNRSPEELGHLWLHLEQNRFRPDSLGNAVFAEGGRYGSPDGFVGGVALKSLTADGKPLSFRVYDTVAKVDLPRPLAPRTGEFVFEVAWSFAVPPLGVDRMGVDEAADGPIFQIAQWFPAVVKFDDVRGWNALPYLGAGEFYTDFGAYDVRLTVPRDHLVAATGVLANPDETLTPAQRERLAAAAKSRRTLPIVGTDEIGSPSARPAGNGPVTWRFKADRCRTFAWAASRAFAWDAASTGGVLCQSFYPKEGAATWKDSTDHLAFSLEHYGAKWAPYPYPVATNVNGNVGGMEYPMIVFCSDREDPEELWLVTTHEIGHTWFPMVVNTDERRYAWMDEGFNTFMNWYATLARYPGRDDRVEFKGLLPGWFDADRFRQRLAAADRRAIMTPPDRMPSPQVGHSQYGKPAVGLVLLREEILGPERFDAAFREYFRRWAFKSPQPADFFRTMENAAGADLAWFWRGWFYGNGVLDLTWEGGAAIVEPDGKGEIAVDLLQKGGVLMPCVVRATFSDGTAETRTLPPEAWAATGRVRVSWTFAAGKRPVSIVVDPEKRLPDVDRSNNEFTPEF